MSRDLQKIASRLYDEVHAGLWALLCAAAVYFCMFVVPHLSEIRAGAERLQMQEIAAEDRRYCDKWGMAEGSPRFVHCKLDLQEIRLAAERRLVGPLDGF